MSRKPISLRFDEALLSRLDEYARLHGTTRTGLLEDMAVALVEGRLSALPRALGEAAALPQRPKPGSSPVYPVGLCFKDGGDG